MGPLFLGGGDASLIKATAASFSRWDDNVSLTVTGVGTDSESARTAILLGPSEGGDPEKRLALRCAIEVIPFSLLLFSSSVSWVEPGGLGSTLEPTSVAILLDPSEGGDPEDWSHSVVLPKASRPCCSFSLASSLVL